MKIKNSNILIPLRSAKENINMNRYNIRGWTTKRKIMVFESDDWGSIRTSSREAYQSLLKAGDQMDRDPFTRYDALETEDDLEILFEELLRHKDSNGRHPVITANFAVANPDFEKIKDSDFEQYFYEPVTETLKNYKKHKRCQDLWKTGLDNGLFFPQLHCREHVNIARWLSDLREGDKYLRLAFKCNMISGYAAFSKENAFAYMDAFNYYGNRYDELLEVIISDACKLFSEIFGYESASFTASCYVWNDSLERIIKKKNVRYIQGGHFQLLPNSKGQGKLKSKRHLLGEKNKYNQLYLTRNCCFEPALPDINDSVGFCMAQIENSYKWGKPAIIRSHRVNYAGYIDESNRDRNIKELSKLLITILKKWPDVEFMTSAELGAEIANSGEGA